MEKSQTIIFSNKKVNNEWKLRIYNKEMARVASVRLLGMSLDTRLMWTEHINKIVSKCKRVLNVMKCMAGQAWGPDRGALQTVYIAMTRSVLDYGMHMEWLQNLS